MSRYLDCAGTYLRGSFHRLFAGSIQILACLSALFLEPGAVQAQWVAFNDHAPGSRTHPNTTTYHILGELSPSAGPLKDVNRGGSLPVVLTLNYTATGVAEAQAAYNPAAGTLLDAMFGDFVDFAGSPHNSIELTSGTVTYTFTGLDPKVRYSFHGSAVRGEPTYTTRWTLCEIAGAESSIPAHSSSRVLTSTQVPSLAFNQAALNTGVNNTAETGDYVGWDDISPGADGSFGIICRKYNGPVPGGSSQGTKAHALTGIRLAASPCPTPVGLAWIAQPQSQAVIVGSMVALNAGVSGCPAFYQWFKDGQRITGATMSSFHLPAAGLADAGIYSVVVTNQINSITSAPCSLAVYPDRSLPLIPLDHPWRYNQPGADPGTNWHQAAYNDSSWLTGLGAFGFEENSSIAPLLKTPLALTGPTGQRVITYYFRTWFNLTNEPGTVYLVCSNLVDDGGIVRVNGVEQFRINLDPGPVTYGTLAHTASEGVWNVATVHPTNLVQGDNLLAVEVHQSETNSSDVVFGMTVKVAPSDSGPVSFAEQPQPKQVTAAERAVFRVKATGQPPIQLQWRFNGRDIPGQTNDTLTISEAGVSEDGFYSVRATNPFGSARSLPARLEVHTPGWIPFYVEDFSQVPGPEWSVQSIDITPLGARRFLGQFWNETAALSLSNLPAHVLAMVEFDLFVIRSWDGNATGAIGPDQWILEADGAGELLHTTFSNWRTVRDRLFQCFPDPFSDETNPSLFGASEEGTLGYLQASEPMDSVYRLKYTFAHSSSVLTLRFRGENLQSRGDESWGLDNVRVYLAGHSGDGWPVILASPQSLRTNDGSLVVLRATAAGEQPLSYRWFRNGVALGAVNSPELALPGITLAQSGVYTVEVSNGRGTVMSLPASLLVLESLRFQTPTFPLLGSRIITLRLNGLANRNSVVVESSSNLQAGSWTPIRTNPAGISSVSITEPCTNPPTRFYRAVER